MRPIVVCLGTYCTSETAGQPRQAGKVPYSTTYSALPPGFWDPSPCLPYLERPPRPSCSRVTSIDMNRVSINHAGVRLNLIPSSVSPST